MIVKSIAIKFIFFARFVRGSREKTGARARLVRVYNAREMCVREVPSARAPAERGALRHALRTRLQTRGRSGIITPWVRRKPRIGKSGESPAQPPLL